MAKGKKQNRDPLDLESSVLPILEIGYSQPLFSLAAHPTAPIVVAGLATGHIYCHSYDAQKLEDSEAQAREQIKVKGPVSSLPKKTWLYEADHSSLKGTGVVNNWSTKRHKGSCRSVLFDVLEGLVGDYIYSVGKDDVIKKAKTETGKVSAKSEISSHYLAGDAVTTLAMSLTNPFLLAGTENGEVLVFDSSNLGNNKVRFRQTGVHEDSINKILPMPAVSAYHYLTLGLTTLSHLDIRKGIITQSDDQSDELLSMCYPTNYISENKNDTVIVSHGEGILTLWKNSANRFMDQLSRIKINKSASIDAVILSMNGAADMVDSIWCGDSEGLLYRLDYKKGKIMETRVHSAPVTKRGAVDEVGGLEIDYDYRLISSGMESMKIWSSRNEAQNSGEGLASEDSDSDSDSDSDADSDTDSDQDSGLEMNSGMSEDDGAESLGGESDFEGFTKSKSSKFGNSSSHLDHAESAVEEGSDLDADSDAESRPAIVRKKRTNITQLLGKAKKGKININPEVPAEPEKKTKKKLKVRKTPNHGIAHFEGL